MKMPNLLRNAVLSRTAWLQRLFDPRRDVDQECGHPQDPTIEDYQKLFVRGDIAARVITLYPEETWSEDPTIFETEDEAETAFEEAWQLLNQHIPTFSFLQRADMLSGIGRFGGILLGIDDGKPLTEPVDGIAEDGTFVERQKPERTLLYLRPLDESVLSISTLENRVDNPRYGQPTMYQVQFADIGSGTVPTPGSTMATQRVHWSRIIHIADNRTNSEIYGRPRLEKVLNRILDIRKIAGGSGEMFWKGGFPGLSIESNPSINEDIEFDADATKEQIESYMNGLQRYISTVGMTAKSLSVQVADPGPHLEVQLRLIAVAMSVPWRVFIGSEAAQLASEQDARAWNKRITRRRLDYINPFLIRPFIDRLIALGVLPTPAEGYQIDWPDPNTPSDKDQADVAEKRTNALAKYVSGGADVLVPPFHYLTLILKMEEDEAKSIIEAAADEENLLPDDEPTPQPLPRGDEPPMPGRRRATAE